MAAQIPPLSQYVDEKKPDEKPNPVPGAVLNGVSPLATEVEEFHDLFFQLELDGTIVDYQANSTDLYVSPEHFSGRRMQDVLPPPIGQKFAEAIVQVGEKQARVSLSYSLLIEGAERHFEAHLLPAPPGHIVVIVGDVTRYANVSAAHAQLSAILEATPDYVGTSDAEGRPLYLNRAGRLMIGLSEDEELPDSVEAFHPEWARELRRKEALPTARRDGVWRGESALLHRDGHEISISQVVIAHKAPNGTVSYFSTVARDISERKQVEAALRESQRQLQTLINALPGIAFACRADAQWTPSFLSEGCLALTGYRADELVDNSALNFYDIIHPDDLSRLMSCIKRSSSTRRPYVCEYRIRAKDGVEKWLWEKGSVVFDAGGNARGLEGFITDITENKQTRQALEDQSAAMTVSMDGMAVLDNIGIYRYVNQAHAHIYGYDSPAELLGKQWSILYSDEELERFHDQIMPDFWKAGHWRGEAVGTRRDGSTFPQEISLSALSGGGMVCVVRDIRERKQAEEALREAESQYRSIFENAIEGIFQSTVDGQYLKVNPALATLYGYESPAAMIADFTDIGNQLYLEAGRREEFQRLMKEQGQLKAFESPVRRRDGSIIWISENSNFIYDEGGEIIGYEGTAIDTTARHEAEAERLKAEAALRDSETRLREIVEHSSNLFYTRTPDNILTYISPQVRQFLDCEPEEALVHWMNFATDNPINQDGFALAESAITTGQAPPLYHLELIGKKGRKIFVEVNEAPVVREGKTVAVVGALVDITERHLIEQQLKHQAFHDSLTNLPNRSLFMDRLQHAIRRLSRHKGMLAVLFLDLDRFKVINDSLGHDVGDQLLQAVTARLMTCLRTDDTVARLGGDEFTILMEDISEVEVAVLVAERIAEELQQPFLLKGQEVFVTTSIGITISESADSSPDDLLRDADVAMYRAKTNGRAQYEVFDPDMNARAMERLTLETDLWQALRRGELCLHYQPKVDLNTQRIKGVEALVRWQHPVHGLVLPNDFIPLAEETNMILSIGQWVLREACLQACRWKEQLSGYEPLQMSVNLSVRQLQQPRLAEEVAGILKETGLPPHLLKLEITESGVMSDAEHTIATLRDLKALGVELAIDDFGTGYSSLSYLRRFPVSTLKIDRSFIRNLGSDREDTEIVRAIINLAQTLGLQVTAEGIETPAQAEELKIMACDWGQGFFFSKPVTADTLSALLDQENPAPME